MKFGLTKEEYQFIQNNVVEPVEKLGGKVFCFGSRSRGDHRKFSDLDLMVEGEGVKRTQVEGILESVQESHFPYKLDLVLFGDFAESYKNNYLRERVPF